MAGGTPLLPVADALARILKSAPAILGVEQVPLAQAHGRTLAEDLVSKRTQPPFDVSAMDGYAVRAADLVALPARLKIVGTSAAGRRYADTAGAGEAVRIFTGAPMPDGTDTVVIQEDTKADGDDVIVLEGTEKGRNIRLAGLDFRAGEVLLLKGRRLGPNELALAAAMNHATLPVAKKPVVAILATGDELVTAGEIPGPDQIVASNVYAVAAFAESAGAQTINLGIAADSFAALEEAFRRARDAKADVLVTLGGASVGDHDLVQSALTREGMEIDFWRVAMRPGKPLMHGRLGDMRIVGLPGNPVAGIVCSLLFLAPLVRALCGDPQAGRDHSEPARLGGPLKANDIRQDYLRARLTLDAQGQPVATAHNRQDSSMLRVLAEAECLIVRAPHEAAAQTGDACRIIRIA